VQSAARHLSGLEVGGGTRIGRIPEHGGAREPWNSLLEELHTFSFQLRSQDGKSRDISSRAREAHHEPTPNGIGRGRHDDGDRPGRLHGCESAGRPRGHDDDRIETDQVGRELGEPLVSPFCPSVLNGNVLTLDVAQVAELLSEGLYVSGL
jgi:hypothetical protein